MLDTLKDMELFLEEFEKSHPGALNGIKEFAAAHPQEVKIIDEPNFEERYKEACYSHRAAMDLIILLKDALDCSDLREKILTKCIEVKNINGSVKWTRVDERLPDKSGKYIVCNAKGMVYQTKFYTYPKDQGGHWGQKDKGKGITHWMRMPEAPKGEK